MMGLAVLYLCAWDYHRVRCIFTSQPWTLGPVPQPRLDGLERVGFAVFAGCLLATFLTTRSLIGTPWKSTAILLGFVAGLFTLLRYLFVGRRLTA
jgi:hypothetical protein